MKIQGSNPIINTYRSQQQRQVPKKMEKQQDELNISTEAKKLQQSERQSIRSKYVEEIKERVNSGQYEVDYEQTAQKMIDFWTRQI